MFAVFFKTLMTALAGILSIMDKILNDIRCFLSTSNNNGCCVYGIEDLRSIASRIFKIPSSLASCSLTTTKLVWA